MVMEPKKEDMQKRPNQMSKHSEGFPTFKQWKPHTPIDFRGNKDMEINHEHNTIMNQARESRACNVEVNLGLLDAFNFILIGIAGSILVNSPVGTFK